MHSLRRAMSSLLAAADKAAIEIVYGKDLEGIEDSDSEVTALFKDGTRAHGDLLLGCDGIHSAVRKLHVDPGCAPEYSGIANMFSLVETSILPPIASSLGELHTTLTTDGILGLTPATRLRDLIYWFFSRQVPLPIEGDTRDGWKETRQKEVELYQSTVLRLLGDGDTEWADMLRDLVCKSDTIHFYPIYRLAPGNSWFKGRCLLLGDATHAMPPHTGQGVSMALEDAFLLARLLESDCPSVSDGLQKFVAKRRNRTEKMSNTAQRNGGVRSKKGPWRLWTEELVACLFAILFLTAEVILIAKFQGRKVSDFNAFSWTMNSVVAFFTALLEASVGFAVAACLGQLRWLWFRNGNKDQLIWVDRLTNSSRPSGALQVIFSRGYKHWAALGACPVPIGVPSSAGTLDRAAPTQRRPRPVRGGAFL